ncbi:MAG: tyrosine-type recombinase/integrase [Planctomycetaceae bacterium]
MARKPNVFPSYLLHQPTGQARVRINGKDHYLGGYGSEESRILYGDLIAKHAGGVQIDPIAKSKRGSLPRNESDDPGPSVGELCLVFLRHAETHYVKNGQRTSEVDILKSVIRPLNELYGMLPAKDFGPLALKAVRVKMIENGWCRDTINAGMSRIRRIFKHAIANELIDGSILQRLQCVAPLLAGRTEAHDNAPRSAVESDNIATVKQLVSPLVRDLIELQRLTGSRSGELLKLTSGSINRSMGDVWAAQLGDHKAVHHGKSRTLHFGPQAQLILTRYLSADPDEKLFKMTRPAYCRAITRACEKAGIERWVPHQLRHTNADVVREEFGLEHAQAVLGHAKADMSEHYAKASSKSGGSRSQDRLIG